MSDYTQPQYMDKPREEKMETGDDVEFILFENGDKVSTNKDRFLVFEDVYMGDHSESWIVEKKRESGYEISRHSTRFIASIYWKPKGE